MKIVRRISIVVLFFTAITAIYGGLCLMIDPSGVKMQLPGNFIHSTPFSNYFFPGMILFVALGLMSLVVSFSVLSHWECCRQLVFVQGVLVMGWIIVQILMLKVIFWLQFIYIAIAMWLMLASASKRLAN
jgi:hypothetical protein